jgi:hypothetical protein
VVVVEMIIWWPHRSGEIRKSGHTHTHGPKGHQATAAANTIIITAKGESESESSNTHTRYNNQPNFLSHSSRKSPLQK